MNRSGTSLPGAHLSEDGARSPAPVPQPIGKSEEGCNSQPARPARGVKNAEERLREQEVPRGEPPRRRWKTLSALGR